MPVAASSTATSPDGPEPAARTARPGSVSVFVAVCTVQAGAGAVSTAVRASSGTARRARSAASTVRLCGATRARRYGGTNQQRPMGPASHSGGSAVRREAAGGHRTPAVDGDPDQRLALTAHRLAVLVPVGVLTRDAAEVLDQAVFGRGR